jgi:DNA repair exonuclease SbcCD ATPase subunit
MKALPPAQRGLFYQGFFMPVMQQRQQAQAAQAQAALAARKLEQTDRRIDQGDTKETDLRSFRERELDLRSELAEARMASRGSGLEAKEARLKGIDLENQLRELKIDAARNNMTLAARKLEQADRKLDQGDTKETDLRSFRERELDLRSELAEAHMASRGSGPEAKEARLKGIDLENQLRELKIDAARDTAEKKRQDTMTPEAKVRISTTMARMRAAETRLTNLVSNNGPVAQIEAAQGEYEKYARQLEDLTRDATGSAPNRTGGPATLETAAPSSAASQDYTGMDAAGLADGTMTEAGGVQYTVKDGKFVKVGGGSGSIVAPAASVTPSVTSPTGGISMPSGD